MVIKLRKLDNYLSWQWAFSAEKGYQMSFQDVAFCSTSMWVVFIIQGPANSIWL